MPAAAEIVPLATESAGQDHLGRFTPGNKLAKGNPHAKIVAKNRSFFMDCGSRQDVEESYKELMKLVRKGNLQAIMFHIEQLCGKAATSEGSEEARAHIVQMYLQQTIHNHAAPAAPLAPHLDGSIVQVIATPTQATTERTTDEAE